MGPTSKDHVSFYGTSGCEGEELCVNIIFLGQYVWECVCLSVCLSVCFCVTTVWVYVYHIHLHVLVSINLEFLSWNQLVSDN